MATRATLAVKARAARKRNGGVDLRDQGAIRPLLDDSL